MKQNLLVLLLLCSATASAGTSIGRLPDRPDGQEHPHAPSVSADRLPTFLSGSTKESIQIFRNWFEDAYKREIRLYRKRNKGSYQYDPNDFQSFKVSFFIDTTGRPILMATQPELLSDVQAEVLQKTFERCPSWIPAVQNGRKVRVKYTMPVIDDVP